MARGSKGFVPARRRTDPAWPRGGWRGGAIKIGYYSLSSAPDSIYLFIEIYVIIRGRVRAVCPIHPVYTYINNFVVIFFLSTFLFYFFFIFFFCGFYFLYSVHLSRANSTAESALTLVGRVVRRVFPKLRGSKETF